MVVELIVAAVVVELVLTFEFAQQNRLALLNMNVVKILMMMKKNLSRHYFRKENTKKKEEDIFSLFRSKISNSSLKQRMRIVLLFLILLLYIYGYIFHLETLLFHDAVPYF